LVGFAEGEENGGEIESKVSMNIFVNGKQVRSFKDADPYDTEAFLVECGADLLCHGENSIKIELESGGPLNYSAVLSYMSAERKIEASAAGYKVSRSYTLVKPVQKENKVEFERLHSFRNDGIVSIGDLILVEVVVECEERSEYFILTDYLPAGFEVDKEVERTLLSAPQPEQLHREVHDEKVVYFATKLTKGKHTFSYFVRPTVKGVFSAMPSVGELMYFPDVRGNSDETLIEVR
ncbi:MAG: hypothetical protein N2234_09240, partial [Planctomycetota bacterium]|nr:hypothetical protein [Planctomycetota bacterium]